MAGQSKQNKNRKYGRTLRKGHSARYKAENRKMRNKIKKLTKHCLRFPEDEQAKKSLDLITKGKPGIRPKKRWVRKYKIKTEKNHITSMMMYRQRIN